MYHGPVTMRIKRAGRSLSALGDDGYEVYRDGSLVAVFRDEGDAKEYIDALPIMECRRCGFTNGCAICEDGRRELYRVNPGEEIGSIFRGAREETFRDGMESAFAIRLRVAIIGFGNAAIDALAEELGDDIEASGEALRLLGDMEDERTHGARLALLLRALESPDARMRDAASIGLVNLEDPAALDGLRRAVEVEQTAWVRANLELALRQFQDHAGEGLDGQGAFVGE